MSQHAPATIEETADERLLREVLEVPSLSGDESRLAAYLVRAMSERGMAAHIDEAGNAVGIAGTSAAGAACADIVLLGHMDTVPGHIPVVRDGDTLHGRGAVDAKGPLAAFIAAASRVLLPAGVRVVVIGATEEESATSRGARHAAAHYRPAACIIGEPSYWDGVTLGYKGRLLVKYSARRSGAHTSRPVPSLADECCAWWERVRRDAEASRGGERAFDRVQATMRSLSTGSDGLEEWIEALAAFRLPPGVAPLEMEAICGRHVTLGVQLGFSGAEVAHVADRSNLVARSLSAGIRAMGGTPQPRVKTGTSDMNVVGPVWGCPIAAYGPGDSALDHTPEERISLREFALAVGVLRHAIERIARELVPTPSP